MPALPSSSGGGGDSSPKRKKKRKKKVDAWWTPLVPKSYEDDVARKMGSIGGDVEHFVYHTPLGSHTPIVSAGILGLRALNDAKHAAIGAPAAFTRLGKAAWNDTPDALLLGAMKLQTPGTRQRAGWDDSDVKRKLRDMDIDNIVREQVESYKYIYGPAFNGDKQTTLDRMAEHPLGPVLDALTVVTLGSAAAGKAGVTAARIAPAGSALERGGRAVSGMQRVTVPTKEGAAATRADAKAFIAKETAGQRRVRGATIKGTNDEVLLPAKRVIVGETRRLDETENMSPRPMLRGGAERDLNRETLGGEAVDIGRYSSNPAIRVRQRAFDALSEALPSSWIIGAERRSVRLNKQSEIRKERVRIADGGADEMTKAIRALDGTGWRRINPSRRLAQGRMRTAFMHEAQGVDPKMKLEQLRRDEATLLSMTDEDVTALSKVVDELPADDPRAVMAGHFLRAASDRKGTLTHLRLRQREIQNLLDKPLNEKQTRILNEALNRVGRISDNTTSAIREGGVTPRDDVALMPQRIAGVPESEMVTPPAIVPQVVQRTSRRSRRQMAAGNRNLHAPPRPDSTRERTGVADRFGMAAMDPRTIVYMNKQANTWLTQKRLWQTVLDRAREVPIDGVPKKWREVPADKWDSFIKNAHHMLDDELPAAFGDSPQLRELQEMFGEALRDKVGGRALMVPEAYYAKLMNELKPTKSIWLIDKPTALWRLATVSALRPAFLATNIIGQTALLLLSQNVLGMIGSLLHADGRGMLLGADGRALRLAPSAGVVGHGINREIARETRRMAHATGRGGDNFFTRIAFWPLEKAADANDLIGRFSGAVSDDPFRRIAFANEIRKPAMKVLRARRKENPAFTYQDAMREVLDDPALMDRIERKVLGDLVDFEDLSRGEREILRRVSPFYSWIKGSSKITARLLLERPELATLLYHAGEQGHKDQVKAWGKVPDWVYGQIQVGEPDENGNQRTFNTLPFNPFVTPIDQAAQILQPFGLNPSGEEFGGENLLAGTSPIVKMALAGGSGIDPFTGTVVSGGTPVSRMFGVYGMSFPQIRAAHNKGKDHGTMRYPGNSVWWQYAGDPRRYVNVADALEQGSKPPRRSMMLRVPGEGEKPAVTVVDGHGYGVYDAGNPDDWDKGGSGRRRRRTRRKRKARKARS